MAVDSRSTTHRAVEPSSRSSCRFELHQREKMAEKKTLLLVDDEEENLIVLSALLEEEYRVLTARTVREALVLLERERVDLLITDQRMPQTSGVELLRQARQRYPHVVRMALTAYTDVELMLDAINEGAVYRYVIKPWSVDEMRTTIRQAMAWGDLQREHGVLAAELGRANEELQRRNDLLQRRNEELSQAREHMITREKLAAVGRFAAEMAHEMNQHLHVVGFVLSELLLRKHDDETRESLNTLAEHTDQLAELIRDIQDFARRERPDLKLAPVDPRALVVKVASMCRRIPSFRFSEIVVDCEDVGPWVLDQAKIMHLVANLLRNALSASPPCAPVTIRLHAADETLVLEVEDHGPGIPENLREWVFEAFHTTKGSEGSGLGLTICKWVASLHGGSIEVRDAPGGGALIVVSLPKTPTRASAAP
jgi:signal transduction histidine kinase